MDETETLIDECETLKTEVERLTDMHRKAVAEAAILLAEKTDRDEEIERLRDWIGRWANCELPSWLDEEIGCALAGEPLSQSEEARQALSRIEEQ